MRRRGGKGAGGGISRESGRARTVIAASERGLHRSPPPSSCTCHYGITARPPPPLAFIVPSAHTSALASHSQPCQGWVCC